MVGIALDDTLDAKTLRERLTERGLLATSAGPDVVRFLPPLNVGEEHVEEALAILSAALTV